jgi:exopolyphosphatase/guanosine-5'-triphosphate,3'-diphosphate pyrophosphatase
LQLHQAISVTTAYLEDVVREVPATRGARVMVGLAGTVSAAASIEQGLPEYRRERIHHFVLTRAAAEDVFRTVATESARDRAHNPGLEAGRVDTIVGGMCVLVAVMRFFSHEACVVSEADLLDGLAQSLEV